MFVKINEIMLALVRFYYIILSMNTNKTQRINQGHYYFKGWEIEKMETGQWNMRPIGDDDWTDAANTLSDAKKMIERWT